jgi:histidinol-phosphate/aromatic aminotransferase/cobyric acid decarboxylase-like protein
VNHIAQSAAIAALADEDFLQESISSNRQGLIQLANRKAAKPYALEKVRVITKLSNACNQPTVTSLTSKY